MLVATRDAMWATIHAENPIELVKGQPINVIGWSEESIQKLLEAGYAEHGKIEKNPVTEDKSEKPVKETKKKGAK